MEKFAQFEQKVFSGFMANFKMKYFDSGSCLAEFGLQVEPDKLISLLTVKKIVVG